MDELPVITQQQHAGGVLVQAAHGLHTLQTCFGGTLTQGRRQQAVDAGPGGGFVRALGACWFVQQHIGLGVVLPIHALHLKCHAIGGLDGFAVVNKLQAIAPVAFHQALLHQTCANAAGAKALGKQQVIEIHQGSAC